MDLYEPFNGLITRLNKIESIDIGKLLGGLGKLLECLGIQGNATLFAEAEVQLRIGELSLELPANLTDRLKEYVQTPDFAQIHKFVWSEGSNWNDVNT